MSLKTSEPVILTVSFCVRWYVQFTPIWGPDDTSLRLEALRMANQPASEVIGVAELEEEDSTMKGVTAGATSVVEAERMMLVLRWVLDELDVVVLPLLQVCLTWPVILVRVPQTPSVV